MRENRFTHYADIAVYPVLIAVMIPVIADQASSVERALALAVALAGALLWTLVDYLLQRFAREGDIDIAGPHDRNDDEPGAWSGTPSWLGVSAITFILLLPASLGVRLMILGVAGGTMAAFLWLRLVHHAIGGTRTPWQPSAPHVA